VPRLGRIAKIALTLVSACQSFGSDSGGATPQSDGGVSPDGGQAVDARIPFTCPTDPTVPFCDAFEGGDLLAPWGGKVTQNAPLEQNPVFDQQNPRSGMSCVKMFCGTNAGGETTHAFLRNEYKILQSTTAAYHFAFRYDGSGRHVDVGTIALESNPVQFLGIHVEGDPPLVKAGSSVPGGQFVAATKDYPAPAVGQWMDVVVTVHQLDTTNPNATFSIDGAAEQALPLVQLANTPTLFSISLGPSYADVGDPVTYWFDNVYLELK
jgi:hypothetical protein